jgi:CRP-like cAMP-binding protein
MADRGDDPHFDSSGPVPIPTLDAGPFPRRVDCGNRLLDTLPEESWDLIEPHLRQATLAKGQVVEEEGRPSSALYFPVKGGISLELGFGRRPLQLALIGREGLIGTALLLGGMALGTARVQFEGTAWMLSAASLGPCLEESPQLHRHLLTAVAALLGRLSRVAWSGGHGMIENRLAGWLIAAAECLDDDHIELTHQATSEVLGVRRPSVTIALQALEERRIIQHRRGVLRILDKQRLAAVAGDCTL